MTGALRVKQPCLIITNCGVITNCVVTCAAICNKLVYYKLRRYYKLYGNTATKRTDGKQSWQPFPKKCGNSVTQTKLHISLTYKKAKRKTVSEILYTEHLTKSTAMNPLAFETVINKLLGVEGGVGWGGVGWGGVGVGWGGVGVGWGGGGA